MRKALSTIVLALGLAITAAPAYAGNTGPTPCTNTGQPTGCTVTPGTTTTVTYPYLDNTGRWVCGVTNIGHKVYCPGPNAGGPGLAHAVKRMHRHAR